MRTTDRNAILSLKEAVLGFLDSISVEHEQDFAGSLELSVSLCSPGQDVKPSPAKSRMWESTTEAGGVPLRMSLRLKGGDNRELGAFDRLKPFAVNFVGSLDAWRVSDSMELYLKLYEAWQTEEAPEDDDGIDDTDDLDDTDEADETDETDETESPETDYAIRRAVSSVWRGSGGISKTLFSLSVSLAEDSRKKYIGRKFEAIHRSRELAVQFLYSLDARPEQDFAEALELFLSIDDVAQDDAPEVKARCREIAGQVRDKRNEIDGVLLRVVTGWRPERITSVDRTILRLMMLEGFFLKALPAKSAITEAINLARSFGTDNSPRFVNGVMHKAAAYFDSRDDGPAAVIR